MSPAEKLIDRCRDFEQSDFLDLAMLAIDQALVPAETQNEVEAMLREAAPDVEGT